MVGSVTVQGSGEPVAGAAIQVVVGRMEKVNRWATVVGQSNHKGQYSVEIPVGHARSVVPEFPPGYWGEKAFETFVTTADKPVFTKNYVVQRGSVWQFRILPSDGSRLVPSFRLNASRKRDDDSVWNMAQSDDHGAAQVTMPGSGGEFKIGIYIQDQRFEDRAPATLTFEEGFRPDEGAEITAGPNPGTFRITDKQGRSATLKGARATLESAVVMIELDVQTRAPETLGRVTGLVVDENDRPVAGAAVAVGLGEEGGADTGIIAYGEADAAGRFTFDKIPTQAIQPSSMRVSFLITREGYAGVDSEEFELPQDSKTPRDVGRIRLARGHSVRLHVVGPEGEPITGAWVEPNSGGYANWAQVAVTDAEGRCVVRNLHSGHNRFRAEYGNLFANFDAEAGSDTAETTVQLKPLPRMQRIPMITGVVQGPDGRPVPQAIVRFGIRQFVDREPVVADEEGRFELQGDVLSEEDEPKIPLASLPLVAFDPYGPLAARLDIPVDKRRDVVLTLEPHETDWPLQELATAGGEWERHFTPPDVAQEREQQSLRGKPAPELDGALWLNTEKPEMSLADFRGKYVLLDFWDIGCWPCHGDFPAIKRLYELYKDKGLVVIGVHDSTDEFELVRKDVAKWGLTFPIVVDSRDRRIMAPYEANGITHWPSYMLIGPDGKVLADESTGQPTLRFARMEYVRKFLADVP